MICCLTSDCMLWRTSNKLREVSPAEMRTMDNRNLVRNRTVTMNVPCAGWRSSAYELIAYTVHGAKMYRVGGIALQFLAQFEDVIVHGAGRRIVVVSPDLVQQFIASDDALGILHHEFQRLKFLSGKGNDFAFADYLHLAEVNIDVFERELFSRFWPGGS